MNQEIVIIDDGSTDQSAEKINRLKYENEKIRIITHENNLGYGASILSGIKEAKGDIFISIDSDGQHNTNDIKKLIQPILKNEADVVIASRYLGNYTYSLPFYTKLGEYLVNFFFWLFFNKKVYNNQSGFRAFSKNCKKIFSNIKYKKFGFCTETLFKAGLENLRIKEIPTIIYAREYGTSYVNLIRILKSIFMCIITYSFKKFNIDIEEFFLKKIMNKIYLRIKDLNIFKIE